MKNKKKPFCEHAQRTDAYVTGEQKGFDAVIRQIAHFRKCTKSMDNKESAACIKTQCTQAYTILEQAVLDKVRRDLAHLSGIDRCRIDLHSSPLRGFLAQLSCLRDRRRRGRGR